MSKRLAEYLNRKFNKQARYFNRKDFEYADWKCKKCGYTVNEFRELIRGRMNTCPECGGTLDEVLNTDK
jgi:DNA-directed RNA polymerase subunit RPC12/RpoP